MHLSRDTYFWFEVHSGKQGHVVQQASSVAAKSMLQASRANTADQQTVTHLSILPQELSISSVDDTACNPIADSIAERAKLWNVARYASLVA